MSVKGGEVLSMIASLEKNPDVEKVILLNLAGSKAYGTSLPTSDTDIRGIFVAKEGITRSPLRQAPTELNIPGAEDGKVYELGAFMKLFVDMNPNIIETLFTRREEILYSTVEYDILRDAAPALLNSNVAHRFSGYAMSQLKRIKGHDKWINNPQPKDPPTQLEYFRLVQNYMNEPLHKHEDFMYAMGQLEGICTMIPFGMNIYGIVADYRSDIGPMFNKDGSIRKLEYEELPEVLKKQQPMFIVKYLAEDHKNAKEKHSNYWNWVKNRNADRHELEEKFGYDTKHAMHLVRLLRMGEEILTTGKVNVFREDAAELLSIRNGAMTLEEILKYAEEKDDLIRKVLYKETKLPKKSNLVLAEHLVKFIQDKLWGRSHVRINNL